MPVAQLHRKNSRHPAYGVSPDCLDVVIGLSKGEQISTHNKSVRRPDNWKQAQVCWLTVVANACGGIDRGYDLPALPVDGQTCGRRLPLRPADRSEERRVGKDCR